MTRRGRPPTGTTPTAETSSPTPSMPWWCASGTIGMMGRGATRCFCPTPLCSSPCSPLMMTMRRLIENCCIKASQQQWDLGHPLQTTARAMRVQVLFTLLMFALATAYRWPCQQEETGPAPVGWQRWRRQLLEQTRDQVRVFAQGYYGIFHLAEYSLLVGVKLKDRPPGIG